MTLSSLSDPTLLAVVRSVPVEPDADQGRQWLTDELAKPVYQQAKPTLFDLISQAVGDFFASLFDGAGGVTGALGLTIVLLVVAALVVVAFLVFGRPRLERRRAASALLFGENDTRDAAALTRSAEAAARSGDFTLAIAEMFRALARTLDERTLVDLTPGTTAGGFARAASAVFPDAADRLHAAAGSFDEVRYLGRTGSAPDYEGLAELRSRLLTARPKSAELAVPAVRA